MNYSLSHINCPSITYSSSEAYIIDHRLYTYMASKKYIILSCAMPDVSAKQICDILLTNDCTAKTAPLNQLKFS